MGIFFSFCAIISLRVIEWGILYISKDILFLYLVFSILLIPFYSIMNTIIYMTFRMQLEDFTQTKLAQELSVSVPDSSDFMEVNSTENASNDNVSPTSPQST